MQPPRLCRNCGYPRRSSRLRTICGHQPRFLHGYSFTRIPGRRFGKGDRKALPRGPRGIWIDCMVYAAGNKRADPPSGAPFGSKTIDEDAAVMAVQKLTPPGRRCGEGDRKALPRGTRGMWIDCMVYAAGNNRGDSCCRVWRERCVSPAATSAVLLRRPAHRRSGGCKSFGARLKPRGAAAVPAA